MNKPAYQQGTLVAFQDFTKEALPLWAYPAAAGIGALGGATFGETPGIGALQGAVLAPAALLGSHAAWRHAAKSAPKLRTWVAGQRLGTAERAAAKATKGTERATSGAGAYSRPAARSTSFSPSGTKPMAVSGAEQEAYRRSQLLRRLGYAGAGGTTAGLGTYGLGHTGLGFASDMARAPEQTEQVQQAQQTEQEELLRLMQAYPEYFTQ